MVVQISDKKPKPSVPRGGVILNLSQPIEVFSITTFGRTPGVERVQRLIALWREGQVRVFPLGKNGGLLNHSAFLVEDDDVAPTAEDIAWRVAAALGDKAVSA